MRHIIPISGKDSLATAIVQMSMEPNIYYEFAFNQTGSELPETFEWLSKVEATLGIHIHRIGSDLEAIIESFGYYLPSAQSRYCTRMSKVEPLEEWVGETPATVYFGIRADENRGGYDNTKKPWITPSMPLQKYGLGIKEVYAICKSKDLMPPMFVWKELVDIVNARFPLIDLKAALGEIVYYMLFAGRTRANCFHCWGQRQYEFAWLFYTHPDLFAKAEWYEHQGSKAGEIAKMDFLGTEWEYVKGDKSFTWVKDTPLSYVRANARKLLLKRADVVSKIIHDALNVGKIDFGAITEKDAASEVLNVTSCGLFCGK